MRNTISLLLLAFCTFTTSYSSNNETKINNNLYKTTSEGTPFFRVGFDAPKIDHRQLLLGIDESTTVGLDWGYDSEMVEVLSDDMYWYIEETKCVIQGYPTASIDTEIPLGIVMSDTGEIEITIDEVINPIENIVVYLKDKELDKLYNIQDSTYQTTLSQGEYNSRFVITFKSSDFVNGTTAEEDVTETSEDTTATTEEETTTEDSSTNESTEETATTDSGSTTTEDTSTTEEETTTTETEEETTTEDSGTNESTEETETTDNGSTTTEDTSTTETEENTSEEEESTSSSTTEEETTDVDDDVAEVITIKNPKIQAHYNSKNNKIVLKNNNELSVKRGKLFNKRGVNIKNWKINNSDQKIKLPAANLRKGLYYLIVKTDIKTFRKKIIVKKS